MTNTWQDIKNANVVLCMGDNAAEAHPCGFKWVIEAKIENKAKLVAVDPRFTRTASFAALYAPIPPGTDIAFLSGASRLPLEHDAIQPACAGLDAAFGRFPEHPHHGDDPASAGQYRRGGRRDERAARPFQHPGPDRCRPSVGCDARLSDDAEGRRGDLRALHGDAAIQAAASGADELLAELSEILRQLPEGDLWRRRARRQ